MGYIKWHLKSPRRGICIPSISCFFFFFKETDVRPDLGDMIRCGAWVYGFSRFLYIYIYLQETSLLILQLSEQAQWGL